MCIFFIVQFLLLYIGFTKQTQEVILDKTIRLIDSPGVAGLQDDRLVRLIDSPGVYKRTVSFD